MTKKRYIYELFCFFILILTAGVIALNSTFSFAVIDGVKLFIACIFPSLFPYLFITAILAELKVTKKIFNYFSPLTKRLFNCPGITLYAYFISIISGYPLGTKTVCDLFDDNLLTETQATRALALCSTSSPVFLIGSVGNLMFNNTTLGILLLLCHIMSSVSVGIIFSFYKKRQVDGVLPLTISSCDGVDKDNFFSKTMESSIASLLFVGGVITLFYLITEMLCYYNLLSPITFAFNLVFKDDTISQGLALSLFECTKGLKILSSTAINFYTLPILSFVCGFGGLSVIMQSIPFIKKAKLKIAPFLIAKLTQAILGFCFGIIISLIVFR